MSDEIVPYTAQTNLAPLTLSDEQTTLTSLDRNTPEGAVAYYNAMIGDALSMSDAVNTTIKVCDAVVHHIEAVDKDTGEIQQRIRIALITKDGKVYHCQSGGVYKTLRIICGTVGPLPWRNGREVIIKQRKVGEKERWLYLELTQEEIARFMKEKKK